MATYKGFVDPYYEQQTRNEIRVNINRQYVEALQRQFSQFRLATKQIVADVVKEESCLTAREAMVLTAPMHGKNGGQGDKKVAEVWGNFAVDNDVRSVVVDDQKSLGAAVGPNGSVAKFAKWKSGNRPKKFGIIRKIFDDNFFDRAYNRAKNLFSHNAKLQILTSEAQIKQLHDQKRQMYKGRIRRNGGAYIRYHHNPAFAEKKLLDNYIKKRQERVGWMKSGWLDAIRKIGPANINGMPKNFGVKDLPQFITKHTNNLGMVNIKNAGDPNSAEIAIVITNKIGNIFKISYLTDTYRLVIMNRMGKMAKRMAHFQRAEIEKFKNKKS
jgi:hypothetical protein